MSSGPFRLLQDSVQDYEQQQFLKSIFFRDKIMRIKVWMTIDWGYKISGRWKKPIYQILS